MTYQQESQYEFDFLIGVLKDLGLDWVVNEVDEQIRIGKPEKREITPYQQKPTAQLALPEEIDRGTSLKSGAKTEFWTTVEYNANERLELLVSAIEQAVINTAYIEQELADFLRQDVSEKLDIQSIRFTSDEEEISVISPEVIARRQDVIENLSRLLVLLRKENNHAGK